MKLDPDHTTILLHMGIHKTGSTTLQKSFAENRGLLSAAGIRFVGHGGPYCHLYSAFLADPMRFVWNRQSKLTVNQIRKRDQKALAELRARLTRCQGKTIIVSNEFLPMLKPEELQALRGFLSQYGKVHAVYFYRELDSWVSSNSQEMAKAGIATQPTDFDLALRRVHHLPLKVFRVFGPNNTTFIRFEDAAETGICNTFLASFGLPTLTQLGGEEIVSNQSISGPAVEALFEYNRRHPLGDLGRDPLAVERLLALPGEKYRAPGFSPDQIARYKQARDVVTGKLGLSLKAPECLSVRGAN